VARTEKCKKQRYRKSVSSIWLLVTPHDVLG
jgi:hypothetical protein